MKMYDLETTHQLKSFAVLETLFPMNEVSCSLPTKRVFLVGFKYFLFSPLSFFGSGDKESFGRLEMERDGTQQGDENGFHV